MQVPVQALVVIVGAGFAGIGAAIQLQKAGIDFVILEQASAIGGVWCDNHYPDCSCDVSSALYSYSSAPNLYSFTSAFVTLEAQLCFIVSALQTACRDKLSSIEVRPERLVPFKQQVHSFLQRTLWNSGCSRDVLDNNGRNSTNGPWTIFLMRHLLRRFVAADFQVAHAP